MSGKIILCKVKNANCNTCDENKKKAEDYCFSKYDCSVPVAKVQEGKIVGFLYKGW